MQEEYRASGFAMSEKTVILLASEEGMISAEDLILQRATGLSTDQVKKTVSNAIYWHSQAMTQIAAGKTTITINGNTLTVKGVSSSVNGGKCTDFMSASDCQVIFNVCDPFVCPSSRCDLGGEYPVDDVIASGVIGSVALCFPNFIGFQPGGDVLVPVCLTGINAGLDSWAAILESYRDCINISVTQNLTIGICDEMWSIYACDLFWKEIGPFASAFTKNIFTNYLFGKGSRGGGEYMFTNDAWTNAEKSWQYFQSSYAANSKMFLGARTFGEFGAEVCKLQASMTYPDAWDTALSPESPAQVHAWFDEMKYTDATVPARSQYKVFYFIYAGNDQAAQYTIYLKGAETALGGTTQTTSTLGTAGYGIVDSGYVEKGQKKSEAVDFIDTAGYKQVCVRINDKDYCGFKSISTSFALNYAKDKVVQEQAESKVSTESECISGSASVMGALITPNIQQGAEDMLNPQMYNYGVIRVCATDNPGKTVDPTRWKEVGYCDTTSVKCWVDTVSVKNAINGVGIENATLANINTLSQNQLLGQPGYLDTAAINSTIETTGDIGALLQKVGNADFGTISSVLDPEKFDKLIAGIYEKTVFDSDKARLLWKKAQVYAEAAKKANSGKVDGTGPAIKPDRSDVAATVKPSAAAPEMAAKPPEQEVSEYLISVQSGHSEILVDLYSIAKVESNLGQGAKTYDKDGSVGIMQITEAAAEDAGTTLEKIDDIAEWQVNIDAGVNYLRVIQSQVQSNLDIPSEEKENAIVVSYNAGYDAVAAAITAKKNQGASNPGKYSVYSNILYQSNTKADKDYLSKYNAAKESPMAAEVAAAPGAGAETGTAAPSAGADTTKRTSEEVAKAASMTPLLDVTSYVIYKGDKTYSINSLLDLLKFKESEKSGILNRIKLVNNQGSIASGSSSTSIVIPLTTDQEDYLNNKVDFNCDESGKKGVSFLWIPGTSGWANGDDKTECEGIVLNITSQSGAKTRYLITDTKCTYTAAGCKESTIAAAEAKKEAETIATQNTQYLNSFSTIMNSCASQSKSGKVCICTQSLEIPYFRNQDVQISFGQLVSSIFFENPSAKKTYTKSSTSSAVFGCYIDYTGILNTLAEIRDLPNTNLIKNQVVLLTNNQMVSEATTGEGGYSRDELSGFYLSDSKLALHSYIINVDNNVCLVTQRTMQANTAIINAEKCTA